jgi:serine/threonine protein kinase
LQANAPFAYSPLAPPQSNARHSKNHLALGLGLGCTLGVLLVALLSALFFYHRLKTRRTSPYDLSTSKSLQRFSYQQLKKATGGFAEARKLGQGGFGAVFKGELRYGDEVAVKSVDVSTVQGEVAFQNEVSIIGRITSPRIVRLLGFCAHGPRRLLVYEFMANRNLQEALFDEVYAVPLDWAMRFRIIHNVAEGLAYLHFKCDPPIIHGDVKPSNVLLDANFHAKLADFGLARVKTAESILEVQTLEAQREAIEKERARYERIVRDRARRQKRREEAERKKKDEASRANSVKGESMESF